MLTWNDLLGIKRRCMSSNACADCMSDDTHFNCCNIFGASMPAEYDENDMNEIMIRNITSEAVDEIREIIMALRCSCTDPGVVNYKCRKEKCRYYLKTMKEEKEKFMKENPDAVFTDDFWEGCDCEQIGLDAADVIEVLLGGIKTK